MSDQISSKLDALIDTPVGRKIMLARLRSLTQDNARLRRKVAESRIAVHALNEFTCHLVRIVEGACEKLNESGIQIDSENNNRFKRLKAFQMENFGEEMVERIDGILSDTEGDDLLLKEIGVDGL